MPSKTEKPNANFDVSANLLKKLAETMGKSGHASPDPNRKANREAANCLTTGHRK